MTMITVEEAQARLPDLIAHLKPGEELVITCDNLPVAKLVGAGSKNLQPRQLGIGKEMILSIAEDFDAPLPEFKEYME